MINTNTVKAILAFYLKIKLFRWGIPTDEKLALPTDEKRLNKIKMVCKLYYNLHHHHNDKAYLLKFCDELEAIENKERENHHSKYAPGLFDYPVMACTIRALRSLILNSATPHKKLSDVQDYLEGEFLKVIKYEDYHYNNSQFQKIASIKDFVEEYKKDSASYGLLDRVYLLNYKANHADRKESFIATAAMAHIDDLTSTNKQRQTNMAILFAEKADRKAAKTARPVIKAFPPADKRTNLEELDKILAELEADDFKRKANPTPAEAASMRLGR